MKARKLKSGSWNVRVMVRGKSYSFTDSDRRRCMRRAAEFADQVKTDVDNPRLVDALERFVESRAADLSPSTVRGYAGIVRATRTRAPQIASKRIMSLTDRDIQALINPLSAPKTQRNYVNLISKATGRKFSVHYRNKRPKDARIPTVLEIDGLVRIFYGTDLEVPVLLGAYAGLRRGEICALTINDLDGDYLHINKDMVLDDHGAWITKEPKTPASNRTVLLPHHVVERVRQKGYITRLKPNSITKRFIQKQTALGIDPPYTFHSLRHFFASYLHSQSIPDAYIMRAGGWATPHVMQTVYRHALDDVHLEISKRAVSAFQNPCQAERTTTQ
jgi:integrase